MKEIELTRAEENGKPEALLTFSLRLTGEATIALSSPRPSVFGAHLSLPSIILNAKPEPAHEIPAVLNSSVRSYLLARGDHVKLTE